MYQNVIVSIHKETLFCWYEKNNYNPENGREQNYLFYL